MSRFWELLEAFPQARAGIADWKRELRQDWDWACQFLQPTHELATTYPNPNSPVPYFVSQVAINQWMGVDPESTTYFPLTADQLTIWELKTQLLIQTLRRSANLRGQGVAPAIQANLWHLGHSDQNGLVPLEVYFGLACTDVETSILLTQFLLEPPGPICLLLPTRRLVRRSAISQLRIRTSFLIPLDEATQFLESGRLTWHQPLTAWCLRDRVVPTTQANPRNLFRRKGAFWEIAFGGITELFAPMDGYFYLARILAQPALAIPVEELLAASQRQPLAPQASLSTTDRQSLATLQTELVNLRLEQATAKRDNDQGRSEQLDEEIQAIVRQLASDRRLDGQPRQVGESALKAKNLVTQAIRRAKEKIFQKIPGLSDHLDRTLTVGLTVFYDSETQWQCD